MNKKPSISAVVITRNEGHQIARCLDALSFVNEIVVFDSQSTDDTAAICRRYTDKVTITDWPGDGPQKNRAIKECTSEWILCIDADEIVTPELADEIQKTILSTTYTAFSIPFLSHYCNRPIRFGDWKGERHVRLFKRGKGSFTSAYVYGADGAHCRLEIDGALGKLSKKIYHYPFPNLERMLEKLNAYSSGSAKIRQAHKRRGGVLIAIAHGLWCFLRGYGLRLGFLDGREGFILAVSNAEGTYYRYLKLMYLQRLGHQSR